MGDSPGRRHAEDHPEGTGGDHAGNHPRGGDPGAPGGARGMHDGNRAPAGDAYDWYVRGIGLLRGGNPAAAVQVLRHAAAALPGARSVREALARAQFDSGLYPEARESFAAIVEADPVDHYARFGLGLAASRTGDFRTAVEHLSLATAMRPDLSHYARALRRARAGLRS